MQTKITTIIIIFGVDQINTSFLTLQLGSVYLYDHEPIDSSWGIKVINVYNFRKIANAAVYLFFTIITLIGSLLELKSLKRFLLVLRLKCLFDFYDLILIIEKMYPMY